MWCCECSLLELCALPCWPNGSPCISRFLKKQYTCMSTLLLNLILWYLSLYFVFPICHNQVYMYNESVQEYMCVKCMMLLWWVENRRIARLLHMLSSVHFVVSLFQDMDNVILHWFIWTHTVALFLLQIQNFSRRLF